QLSRIGPAFLQDRGGLAPDQLGAAGAEAPIAAEGQLVRAAVEGAVAAFHRLDAQGVAGAQRADGHGAEQRGQVVAEAEVGPQPAALGLQVGQGVELEEAGQGGLLLRGGSGGEGVPSTPYAVHSAEYGYVLQ